MDVWCREKLITVYFNLRSLLF